MRARWPVDKRRSARLTGLLYLAIFVIAPFPFLVVPGLIVVDGDAATTAANIASSEGLSARSARSLSFATAAARVAEAVVQAVKLFIGGVALLLVSGAAHLTVFEPAQLDALTALFLDLREFLTMVWGVLFAFHLTLLERRWPAGFLTAARPVR